MKFLSLEPFIPSGSDFEASKQLFREIGFSISWDAGDYVGFQKDACRFVLQKYDNKQFAENLMVSVKIESAEAFWESLKEKQLSEKYGIRISNPAHQSYGIEVNLTDIAGVCWHFVE